jgi:hypothetical protein
VFYEFLNKPDPDSTLMWHFYAYKHKYCLIPNIIVRTLACILEVSCSNPGLRTKCYTWDFLSSFQSFKANTGLLGYRKAGIKGWKEIKETEEERREE